MKIELTPAQVALLRLIVETEVIETTQKTMQYKGQILVSLNSILTKLNK